MAAAMIDEMSAKIRYRSVRIPELMNEIISENTYAGSTFVKCISEELRGGMQINEAWINASEHAGFLGDEERDILKNIGTGLGGSDTDGQLSMLSLAGSMLMRCLEDAENEYAGKSRMIMSVWTLCGIGAGIFII